MDRTEDADEGGVTARAWREEIARSRREPPRLPPPAEEYRTPAGILLSCGDLAAAHGGSPRRIGATREGRPLWAFRFGPMRPGGAFLVSLLHACEWVGPLLLLDLSERLARERASLPLTIVPIANPDGAARARDAALRGSPRFIRGNAAGVDLNRNFPGTHCARGFFSAMPWYRPGPAAASEPETAAIVALVREVCPAVALSFHSFGRWVFYPPAHRRLPWPGTDRHAAVLERAGGARSIGYRSKQLGCWSRFFRAHGTEIDFLSGADDSLAYLIEVSRGGIARWGLRRLPVPFFAYNPRRPGDEIARLVPFCARLISASLEG